MKIRVAAVVQRFGKDIVGGESLSLQVLTRLNSLVDLTVLTTCARDYVSWANEYPVGEQREGDLRVIRFPVRSRRPVRRFNLLSRLVLQRRLPALRWPVWLEDAWIVLQGPRCPGLLEYIDRHRDLYDAFLFYTYLYYTTVKALPLVAPRSILIPTAHDERPIYLRPYSRLFRLASAFIFLSEEEQGLVNRMFGTSETPQRIAAMRVPALDEEGAPSEDEVKAFLVSRGLDRPYFIYVGRVDVAKGIDRMFSYFGQYVREVNPAALLVLVGSKQAEIPESNHIRYLGVLSESEKRAALLGSRGLLHFSPYESFSVSLLEAFGLKRPAIVPADSPVLAGHVRRSGAGFAVSDYAGFAEAATILLGGGSSELGERGWAYVKANYDWETIEQAYMELIEQVAGK